MRRKLERCESVARGRERAPMLLLEGLEHEGRLEARQRPVEPAGVPSPAQPPRDVAARRGVEPAELADDAAREGVDHQLVGLQVLDPAAQRGRVALEPIGHPLDRQPARHPRVAGVRRGGQEHRVLVTQRRGHRAGADQVPQPTAERVMGDHGAPAALSGCTVAESAVASTSASR